jgi:iron complex transport system substrate-binding protein
MSQPQRIVSLLPSSTEMVCALGRGERLVGVSHECDYPAEVVGLPVLTEPKLDPSGTSRAIDDRVRQLVQDGLSVYRLKTDRLRDLQPDLIVTQDQCEVCAVSVSEVERAVQSLLASDVALVSLSPQRLGDIWYDMQSLAQALGQDEQAEDLLRTLKKRVWKVEQRTRHLERPRVACVEWLDPLMASANWVPEMVEIAGGTYGLAAAGDHSPTLSWDRLLEAQPEVIVIMPCGFPIAQSQAELPTLTAHPDWQRLPAVQAGRVYIVDGNAYFNRPGPRIVESIELLAEMLHPQACAGLAPEDSYIPVL